MMAHNLKFGRFNFAHQDDGTLHFLDESNEAHPVPHNATAAMLSRGLGRYFGSEVSAKVAAWIKSQIAGPDGKADDVTKAQVKAWRKANEELVKAETEKAENAYLETLLSDKVGAGVARLRGLDSYIYEVGATKVAQIVKAQGKKLPTGKGAAATIRAMVDKLLAVPAAKAQITALAQAKMEADQSAGDVEVGDVDFGDLTDGGDEEEAETPDETPDESAPKSGRGKRK